MGRHTSPTHEEQLPAVLATRDLIAAGEEKWYLFFKKYPLLDGQHMQYAECD